MNKTISLIRETIIKLLEEDTKFFEGDSVLTSEGDKGVVTLSKHPFYAVKLNDTGTTHSYHFTNLLVDPEAEAGLDLGKYDVDPQPKEEQPEIKEIKVNKPSQYKPDAINNFKKPEQGKNIRETITNLLLLNPYLSEWQIMRILSDKMFLYSPQVVTSSLRKVPCLQRYQITNPESGKKLFLYYIDKPKQELKESSPSEIIYLDGLLSVQEDLNVTDVLSDIRSIPGITVVRPVDIPGESHKNKLKIKIDPYPFNGSDETSIKNKIKQLIRKVPGVKEFFTNIAQINEIKFTIKDPK